MTPPPRPTHCKTPGCTKKVFARGRCEKHYLLGQPYDVPAVAGTRSTRHALSTFGENVLAIREQRGIRNADLAKRAGIGVNTLLPMIYRTPRSPALYAMEWVAEALGVPLWQLLAPPGSINPQQKDIT